VNHFATDYGAVKLTTNRSTLFPGVGYGSSNAQMTLLNGVYSFTLTSLDFPEEPPLLQVQDLELLPGTSYTIQITGLANFFTLRG